MLPSSRWLRPNLSRVSARRGVPLANAGKRSPRKRRDRQSYLVTRSHVTHRTPPLEMVHFRQCFSATPKTFTVGEQGGEPLP